jgi:hypothetical protein
MLNAILLRGANVSADENKSWASACGDYRRGIQSTSSFKRGQGRFVFDDGGFFPLNKPWQFCLFPEDKTDRERLYNMTVKYGRKHYGKTEKQTEEEEFSTRWSGRFYDMAIPPEKAEAPTISRFGQVIQDD